MGVFDLRKPVDPAVGDPVRKETTRCEHWEVLPAPLCTWIGNF